MERLNETYLSQYANSPRFVQIIENWNENIDPQIDFDEFYRYLWNIDTAIGFGLDIWGKKIGVPRYLWVVEEKEYFGFYNESFDEQQQVYVPFNVRPFFNGLDSTPSIRVEDELYRRMILAKAYANISRATVETFNFMLEFLFGEGSAFVIDGHDMSLKYVFNITVTPIIYAIIYRSGILPRPAGVKVNFDEGRIFGFNSGHVPNIAENWPWPWNVSVYSNQNND